MQITKIRAIEILDSRGNPTIKTFVELDSGVAASASVPSGASVGSHEAYELRDRDPQRYAGKGVLKAVEQVNTTIAHALQNAPIDDLEKLDRKMIELDGTENKKKLGANAILSVSLSAARARAKTQNILLWKMLNECYFAKIKPSFPRLMVNVINGGLHAQWNFDIQEFMVIPKTNKPTEAVRIAAEIFHQLGNILRKKQFSTLTGDEGGYSPTLSSNNEAFSFIIDAIMHAGHKKTIDVDLGIDAAATAFFNDGAYTLKKERKTLTTAELFNYYIDLRNEYGVFSYEDPFAQDDWEGFKQLTKLIPLVVGDDLYTTRTDRIQKGIQEHATHAAIIKPNQIGTLSETADAIALSQMQGMKVVISHRSGETEDSFISDLAVACGADFLKAGSVSRSERLAKYNRLIEIEKREFK